MVQQNKSHEENDKAPYFRVYKHQAKEEMAASSAEKKQVEEPDLI